MRRHYLPLADITLIYDNFERGRTLIAEKQPNSSLIVHDVMRWRLIEDMAR
jgi:predicted ABC-type ATPase